MCVGVAVVKEQTSTLKQCKMCNGYFPATAIKKNKCPECTRIYNEWKNGRVKTPEEKEKYKGIRAHYNIPSYKKIYSVYQYDQEKYNKIWGKIQKLAFKYGRHIYDNTNPYRVIKLCYIKDEQNKPVHLKDEKHIYRYKALHRINELIAKELIGAYNLFICADVVNYLYKRTGIVFFTGECLAEIISISRKPIKYRLQIHITLLRLLREGYELEEIIDLIEWQYKISEV